MKTASLSRRLAVAESVNRQTSERFFQIMDPGSVDPEAQERARGELIEALEWQAGGAGRVARLLRIQYVSPGDPDEDAEYEARADALEASVRGQVQAMLEERARVYVLSKKQHKSGRA